MTQIATTVEPGYEPLPGYVLRNRLGAGGYGEVWSADAPGGLQKAVKIIFGTADDAKASRELKSLERISKVHHPFLLSLERIEVVNNQVVIVTELAESTLYDRFDMYREKGLRGIPRAALLEFLRDAADTLDFLAQKHSLQHLDIKPGNLLIIADRIKVADFGLVKDLYDRDMSMVSGLTPAYSAPEIFDGTPDYRSDQYSLAIVFMEMLTGEMPFQGATLSELARQHIGHAPNLDALPPADRPIIARALSKNPIDRYTTCRQMVDQLLKVKHAGLPEHTSVGHEPVVDDTASLGLGQNTPQIDVAETAHHPSFRVHADSSQDLSEDWTEPRCLFVGIGGLAIKAMVALRQSLLAGSSESAKAVLEEHQWLALDTDCTELEQALDSPQGGLAPKDIVAIPVLHPRDYRSSEPELFSPISRRWLYNIPRTLVTEGVRPLSILTFLQHYNDVRAAIVEAVNTLCRTNIALGVPRDNIRVYVMSSMHGGTGSGLLAEVGLLIRKILIDRDCANCTVSGYGTVATAVNNGNVNLASAAAIATLSEISYFMSANQLAQPLFYRDRLAGPNRFKPFDWFTLVDGGLLGDSDDCRAAAIELAKLVQLDALTTCGASLDSIRTADRAQPEGWLRTATMRRVQLVEKMDVDALKRTRPIVALEKIINHVSSNSEPDNLSAAVQNAELNSWELRCSEFADQVLASIGLVAPSNSVAEEIATANGRRKLQIWTRRLSGNEELKQLQMADDLRQIQNALLHLLEMQKCTCQQIELVQLAIIERMVGFCESSPLPLARYLSDFKEQFGSEEQIIATCIKYCHELVDRSVARNRRFHEARLRLAKQFSAWKRTLQSEPGCLLQFDTPDEDTDASYATKLFDAALFPALLQHTSQALKAAFTEPVDADASTCKPLAPLHFDAWLSTTEAIARELSAKFNDSTDEPSGPQAMPAKDLGSLLPPLANTGGTVTRLVCCPEQGVSTIDRQLKKLGVAETTLVIPRKDQLETFALCEAADINLAAIARVLWRPNAETFQVAERLRTRVDVEWIPASELGSKPI